MELLLSTSPRSTWVWAPTDEDASAAQQAVEDAGGYVIPAQGRGADPRVLDLDIGVDALNGLEALRAAGYTFRWHATQHPLNRGSHLKGVPVVGD